MFAAFDPQGRSVAYVRENNLYVEDVGTRGDHPAHDGRLDTLINGTFDWVYEEELFLRDGFRWSPDGQSIAYWQIDSSGVPEYPMLDTAAGLYPRVVPVRYPKTGQKNPAARVGVVPASGGATRWLEIAGRPARELHRPHGMGAGFRRAADPAAQPPPGHGSRSCSRMPRPARSAPS